MAERSVRGAKKNTIEWTGTHTKTLMVGLKLYSEIYQNFRILEKFLGHRV